MLPYWWYRQGRGDEPHRRPGKGFRPRLVQAVPGNGLDKAVHRDRILNGLHQREPVESLYRAIPVELMLKSFRQGFRIGPQQTAGNRLGCEEGKKLQQVAGRSAVLDGSVDGSLPNLRHR